MTEKSDQHLEAVRAFAREEVSRSSLRPVAEAIGISHTALAGFIRDDSPRTPYEYSRRKLLRWGMARGAIPKVAIGGGHSIGDLTRDLIEDMRARGKPSKEALTRIRRHLRRLNAGGVGESILLAAETLMRENPFLQLHQDFLKRRDVADELADIDRCFQYICETLEEEGYDFSFDPDADEPASPSIEQAAAEAEVLRQLPDLPPLEQKPGKRRA